MAGSMRIRLSTLLGIAAIAAAVAPCAEAREPGHRPAQVTVGVGPAGAVIPPSFLGIATEYLSVPIYERDSRVFDRLLTLLKPTEGGPLTVRIGGLSADHALWTPALTEPVPARAYALTPPELEQIAGMVRDNGLQTILDLNLAFDDPSAEAQMAAA